jgi:hypothetical protein
MKIASRATLSLLVGVLITVAPLLLIPVLGARRIESIEIAVRVLYLPADTVQYVIRPTPHHPDLSLWVISMIANILFYSGAAWVVFGRPWRRSRS